jgi:AcrR family transcriptional regulator
MDVREKLLAAARRVFEEAGSRGATTRRIAAQAGVNEITLFRHFGSKAALIQEALREAGRIPDAQALPLEPRDPAAELLEWCTAHHARLMSVRAMIRTCMGEVEQRPELMSCAGANPSRVAHELRGYVARLQARGMADDDVDPAAAAAMLMGALFTDAMGRDLMPERLPYAPEEAPARYVGLFLRAIGAAAPGSAPSPGGAAAAGSHAGREAPDPPRFTPSDR